MVGFSRISLPLTRNPSFWRPDALGGWIWGVDLGSALGGDLGGLGWAGLGLELGWAELSWSSNDDALMGL